MLDYDAEVKTKLHGSKQKNTSNMQTLLPSYLKLIITSYLIANFR